MRIAVNTQLLIENKLEGLGWFTFEVLKRMVLAHPEHEFIFIFNRLYSDTFIFAPNVKAVILGPKQMHPFAWIPKFTLFLPLALRRINADLYFSPDGWSPLFCSLKKVAVIHDLNFVHHPEWLSLPYQLFYRIFFKIWAKQAIRLATVSEYSRQDISQSFKIPLDKIDVVHNGVNTAFIPMSAAVQDSARERFTGGAPYFIFVGATPPRKNIINLFRAFDLYKQQHPGNHKLVLAGAKKWWASNIRHEYETMQYREDVIFTGRVSSEDLNILISASQALVYVSFFEGFGIPILEAMYCETAVITSNCTSMPEVAGDAALLVNPHSPQEIASAMIRLTDDESLRNDLIERGRVRRSYYSWDKTATLLWNCIEKAF